MEDVKDLETGHWKVFLIKIFFNVKKQFEHNVNNES